MRYPEPRPVRRARARAAAKAKEEDRLARIAAAEARQQQHRRQAARRVDPPLVADDLDRKLAELGITGDRRTADRRSGADRRRR